MPLKKLVMAHQLSAEAKVTAAVAVAAGDAVVVVGGGVDGMVFGDEFACCLC
jgi:hypothetical protein